MAAKQRTRRRLPAIPDRSEAPRSDEELLKQLPPDIISRLQQSNPETKLYQGNVVENVGGAERERGHETKRGKLEISVVEGSFRRIAGIREFADDSGTFVVRRVEILREPGQSLGFYIRQGDGWEREDGVFVSRVNLGSIVETSGLLGIGDEITKVNDVDVTQMSLESVAVIMRHVKRLFLTVKVLTSPAPSSLSTNQGIPQASNCTDGAVNLRPRQGDRIVSARNRRIRILPTDTEPLTPYAYTRIEPEVQVDDESPGYETVRYGPMEASSSELQRKSIPKESHLTPESGHGGEKNVYLIDYDHIDRFAVTQQQYSGQLKLAICTIDNLIPPSDDTSLTCSVFCDSEPTVKVSADMSQLEEGVVKIDREYHIQLSTTQRISFSLVNGLLSSVKSIPLAYFFPTTHAAWSSQEFALTLDPIGRLRFSIGFSPLPSAIPRWVSPATTASPPVGDLREMIAANPKSSGLPLVMERAVQVIEEYGIETAGIYQVTVDQEAKGEALRACQSETLHPSLLQSLVLQLTVHAFTGVLKDLFLNLPQPIFPANLTLSLQEAANTKQPGEETPGNHKALSSFVQCLPGEVKVTVCALLAHFRNICQYRATNGTSIDRISQIFAPLLFTPAHDHRDQADELMSHGDFTRHAHLLKTLILHYK